MRKFRNFLVLALAMLLAGASSTFAQSGYPNKTITWFVGYAPGGNADLRSREVARYLSPLLGQAVVVENRAGAGGNIATDMVKPPGVTMCCHGACVASNAMVETSSRAWVAT